MHRKIVFYVISFLFFLIAIWGGWLCYKNFNATAIALKMEKVFQLIPLEKPADPNGFEAAALAFAELCEKEKPFPCNDEAFKIIPQEKIDQLQMHAVDIISRMQGYVPAKNELVLDSAACSPFSQILSVYRFYAYVQKLALKTGNRALFMRSMHELAGVFECEPSPVFPSDFLLESAWYAVLYDFYINLGTFPDTTTAELETVLRALPSDDFFAQRLLATLKNDYHHDFLSKLDAAEANNLAELRTLKVAWCDAPNWFFYSRNRTKAQYLQYLGMTARAIPLPAKERTFLSPWNRIDFLPAHWLCGNVAGGIFNGRHISGALPSFADSIRDRTNLCRLGIASQIFYRRHHRQILSLDELVSDHLIPRLPIRYSEGKPFELVQRNGESQIMMNGQTISSFFRLIPPSPSAGSLCVNEYNSDLRDK